MKQKLEDLKLLLKNDRRILAAAGFIIAVLFIWILTSSDGGSGRKRRIVPNQTVASESGMGASEAFGDLIVAFRNDIETAKGERSEMFDVLQRTTKDLDEFKERTSGIFETLVDRVEQLARDVDSLAASMRDSEDTLPLPPKTELEGPDELTPLGFDEPTVAPPPREPEPLRVSVIAPGDSVPVQLITGVNAPVDGTPYPVVFKLSGPISGPDGSSLDLGEARIVAAAQGSEADSRALFRLTQLSIRHPNGRRAVVDVDGRIEGEDGIRGLQGKLIDKLGRLIVTTAMVSGVAAIGESMTDSQQITYGNNGGALNLSGDDLEFATASALTDASNRLGQVLLNRYESLVPVVVVLSGREVHAIFSKPVEIAILEPMVVAASGSYDSIE
jgi:hypothetical protein